MVYVLFKSTTTKISNARGTKMINIEVSSPDGADVNQCNSYLIDCRYNTYLYT